MNPVTAYRRVADAPRFAIYLDTAASIAVDVVGLDEAVIAVVEVNTIVPMPSDTIGPRVVDLRILYRDVVSLYVQPMKMLVVDSDIVDDDVVGTIGNDPTFVVRKICAVDIQILYANPTADAA
ncbi:hypothetical protein YTPLAS18_18560 [Nitrospira sp.]|nr:hypothetical protein YTPLAS18_18560 [Nitrospira sp.]